MAATDPVTRTPTRKKGSRDILAEALQSELLSATDVLSTWIRHLAESDGVPLLLELEAWLKGLGAFFEIRNLPSVHGDPAAALGRDFVPELRVVRQAMRSAERCALDLIERGQPAKLEETAETRRQALTGIHLGSSLEQRTPVESLTYLVDSLHDLRVHLDGLLGMNRHGFEIYLSVGKMLRHHLAECRYMDLLMGQRARRELDQVESPVLGEILKGIPDAALRRNTALSLVHMFRLLRYLGMVSKQLEGDRPVRKTLVLLALLHKEMNELAEFLKSRFLKNTGVGLGLWNSAEMVVFSLQTESKRILEQDLVRAASERDVTEVHATVEIVHRLLRNCIQSAVATLVHSLDRSFDARRVFPQMDESLEKARNLRQELWDLRLYMKEVLAKPRNMEMTRVLKRIAFFKETSLGFLRYQDWSEFERLSESLIRCANPAEASGILKEIVAYLEGMVLEVSRRSVIDRREDRETEAPGVI